MGSLLDEATWPAGFCCPGSSFTPFTPGCRGWGSLRFLAGGDLLAQLFTASLCSGRPCSGGLGGSFKNIARKLQPETLTRQIVPIMAIIAYTGCAFKPKLKWLPRCSGYHLFINFFQNFFKLFSFFLQKKRKISTQSFKHWLSFTSSLVVGPWLFSL